MINDAASIINELQVKQNGKIVYDGNSLFRVTNVKSLLELSKDYVETCGTSEYFYLDVTDEADSDDGHNKGFKIRKTLIQDNKIVNAIIPLNKLSFFEGLETNMLPPSQIQLSLQLTDDDTLIYRAAAADPGRVVVTKLVLWIPRMLFNEDGLSYVMENYMKPLQWSYLREMVQESISSKQVESVFNITAGVKSPKHAFIYLQRTARSISQEQNPHMLDTFKVNANNHNCSLQSARLEIGNGVYYPEIEYSSNDIPRIFRDVINYTHKQNDKNTGTLLNRSNFQSLFGLLYFNLTYENFSIHPDPKQIVLRYRLNIPPGPDYKVFAIILYQETVSIDTIGNDIVII